MPSAGNGGPGDIEPMPSVPPMTGGPQDMGSDVMSGEDMPEQEPDMEDGKSDSEINDIFSKLDTEKQAAVIKYAKSMVNDDEPVEEELVNEITNNILEDGKEKPEDGKDEKIRNKKITTSNPFVTKNFNEK